MGDFRFTPDQRWQLVQFRVSPTQIKMLEGHACLVGRAWLRKSPPRTVVSERIEALRKHLRAAQAILEEARAGDAPECRAAAGALLQAVCRDGKEVELLDPARLKALACACDEALTMLPKQARHRDADPRIVKWIYEDLIKGHGMEHYSLGDGDDRPATGTHPPPFTIDPSSSAKSQFREVVGICYEAMTGEANADPERAIKAFIKQRKKWMGHQVPEKDDLLS